MKMYFSGVASPKERDMLLRAGVADWLADPRDMGNLDTDDSNSWAMDSGAYRAWKAGAPIQDVDGWAFEASKIADKFEDGGCCSLDFITMPDVLGDAAETWQRWEYVRAKIEKPDRVWAEYACAVCSMVVPVWQWGDTDEHLKSMVEWAKARGRLVAIGGCVPWMREQDETNLAKLTDICRRHGEHLHILGLNWLKAIQDLAPMVRSCDTSKWLDGARYGTLIFQDKRTGDLVQGHKSTVGMAGASREELSTACARNLNEFVNLGRRVEVVTRKPGRVYTLKPELVNTSATAATSARCQFMSFRFEAEAKERHEAALMRLEGKPWSKR